MSQSKCHLRLVSWTWQWVQWTSLAPAVTRSNGRPPGCGRTGDLLHECAAAKKILWRNHVSMNQNLTGMFPASCGIHATKNRGCFERTGEPNPLGECMLWWKSNCWLESVQRQCFLDWVKRYIYQCQPVARRWLRRMATKPTCVTPGTGVRVKSHLWLCLGNESTLVKVWER